MDPITPEQHAEAMKAVLHWVGGSAAYRKSIVDAVLAAVGFKLKG